MKNKNSLGIILKKIITASKNMTALTAVIITGAVITALFPPLVLERVINDLTAGKQMDLSLAFLFFGFLALSGLLESGQNIMITVFGQRITHGLRSEMCSKLRRLPASYYTKNEPGKITSRFVNDVDVVDSLFTNGIISMFANTFKVISILAVIFYMSTGLGLIMIFVTPVLFAMTRVFQKKMLKAQLDNRVAVGKVNNHMPETIHNIRMIQTLFRQKYMEHKYDDYIQESYRAMDKSNLYDSIYSPIVIFISSCVIAAMMIGSSLGGEIQQLFGITVGTAVAIIAYVGKVFDPLESIGMEIQNIQSAVAGVKRINEFLREPEREETDPSSSDMLISGVHTGIIFDRVSISGDKKISELLSEPEREEPDPSSSDMLISGVHTGIISDCASISGDKKISELLREPEREETDPVSSDMLRSGGHTGIISDCASISGDKKMNELLSEPEREETDPASSDMLRSGGHTDIIFDCVSFSYDNGNTVLSDMSFKINDGDKVTFTGRTGAGKSTIFRLLLGLYKPGRGRVLVNGIDAYKIPDVNKRKLFGYVEQSFHQVPGTVAEQISLYDTAIDREQIENAAKLVGLHENITVLPEGYDTPMQDSAFSQGQLQLLSIARAVAASPVILLLDEITANLDSDTEHRILEALENASKGRTVLSVSHRLHMDTHSLRIIQVDNIHD